MRIACRESGTRGKKCHVLIIGVFEGALQSALEALRRDRKTKQLLAAILKEKQFQGKAKRLFFTATPSSTVARSVILVGLGRSQDYTLEKLRRAVGMTLKHYEVESATTLRIDVRTISDTKQTVRENVRAVTEALILATYRFTKYKSKADDHVVKIRETELTVSDRKQLTDAKRGLEFGRCVSEAANFARDLANEPANELTPRKLAAAAERMARSARLRCTVMNEQEIKRAKMGGLLGVAQGSHEPPRFIILEHRGRLQTQAPIVLVGKGITFDSGGISIKPSQAMDEMKYDMCGAAAVLGLLRIAAHLKLPQRIIGLVPTCENMLSANPQRPGDIIRISNGKTVEVLNTDAEGRLILADGLSYAQRYKPQAVFDLATLTGSCKATFGEECIGMMGNDRGLLDRVAQAGEESGERCWELPMWSEYEDQIKSQVADLKNIGHRYAGCITAGKFLEAFTAYPWVHLDIASTAWFDSTKPYMIKGPSGAGIRVLSQFLVNWS